MDTPLDIGYFLWSPSK